MGVVRRFTKKRRNNGILEEGAVGRDERLLVLGTKMRAPPSSMEGHALSWPIPAADVTEHVPPCHHSNIPIFHHSVEPINKEENKNE